jgi:hypothetical protein
MLVARLRKKLASRADRPRPSGWCGVGYIFCAAVARICQGEQSAAGLSRFVASRIDAPRERLLSNGPY